ncbi:hypothetical protein FQN60_012796 [Etheostoma spectabile]|uniref:small monomeric GTPase n=1 Tax=Etheostoma spectabile TaxID=54343 RepID=A0A5J5DC36_9PERO|nr:hypothetical protein FQN60_012796 [Etheostoma spectabile]
MASATATYGQKESSDQNFDYMFKILIIGNSSVGKTSFLFRYADDSFTPAFVSTVGIDFKVKTIYRNDKRIKLQIWFFEASAKDNINVKQTFERLVDIICEKMSESLDAGDPAVTGAKQGPQLTEQPAPPHQDSAPLDPLAG